MNYRITLVLLLIIVAPVSCNRLMPDSKQKRSNTPDPEKPENAGVIESPPDNGPWNGDVAQDQNPPKPDPDNPAGSPQGEDGEGSASQDTNDDLAPELFALPSKPARLIIDDDFIPFELETETIRNDLSKIRREQEESLPFIRYISLSHLDYLEMEPESFIQLKAQQINSFSIILNSLSSNDIISRPAPVNDEHSVLRIDIRDYNWSREQWEQLVNDNATDPQKKSYPYNRPFDPAFQEITDIVKTDTPVLRSDWMAREGVKPRVYQNLTGLPDTLAELEVSLGVNRVDNINRTVDQPFSPPRATRTLLGAGRSGVSVNNRVLERHNALKGSYWISYDFAASADAEKDVFSSPLGPGPDVYDRGNNSQEEVTSFAPDGGEVIFNLPNGLQGYLLVDEAGNTIDDAPTFIVFNSADRDGAGVIENGRSCFSCHANGIIESQDEMRPFITAADDELFSDFIREGVTAMHIPQSQMQGLIRNDNQVYLSAKDQAQFFAGISDNITQSFDFYDDLMTEDQVASELNLTTGQYQRIIPRLSLELRAALQSANGAGLEREDFEELFPSLLFEIFNLTQ